MAAGWAVCSWLAASTWKILWPLDGVVQVAANLRHGGVTPEQSIHLIWPVELKCGKEATLVKDVNKIMRTWGVVIS